MLYWLLNQKFVKDNFLVSFILFTEEERLKLIYCLECNTENHEFKHCGFIQLRP